MCNSGLTGFLYYCEPEVPTAQYKILSTLGHTFEDFLLGARAVLYAQNTFEIANCRSDYDSKRDLLQ